MKGILKKTEKGWEVMYMKDFDSKMLPYKGNVSLPLHPDSEESLIEGKEVEFDIVMDEPAHRYSHTPYAKIINKDNSTDSLIGRKIFWKNKNYTIIDKHTDSDFVIIDDEYNSVIGLNWEDVELWKIINKGVNEGVNEGVKKLSFRERCRIGNYTPFNIENLMGELSKMKKEPYITQEEFEEFHHTIMDGLNIPREMLEKLLRYEK